MSKRDQYARETVLVVDDDPNSLKFLAETLEREGFTALIATSGHAAVELVGKVVPDLVLMDAVMPGMDGFEATRAIKGYPPAALTPVIFMTGLSDSSSVVNALAAGCVDYVRKPIIVEELLARVRVHSANARKAQDSQLALDASGRNLVALRSDGSVVWCTPGAACLLAMTDPAWDKQSHAMPSCLRAGAARLMHDENLPGNPVRIEAGGQVIELALIDWPRMGEVLVRISLIDQTTDISRLQQQFGLTHREAEVLLWISYGKPNRVISETLSISPRTVNKHLEQIFRKLGVETRAAAAALAVRIIAG